MGICSQLGCQLDDVDVISLEGSSKRTNLIQIVRRFALFILE